MEGWTQAVVILATDAVRGIGRNSAQLSLYGPSHTFESRRSCSWRRFASFSISSGGGDVAVEDDDWRPPDVLDEVARVAATQLPLGMAFQVPPLSEVRPKVQMLVDGSSSARSTTRDNTIPYQDMLSLLCAILQVSNANTPGELINDQF